jgi:protein TonB
MKNQANALAVYGAFELKRSYQRNMSLGILLAAAFFFLATCGFLLYQYISSRPDEIGARVVRIKTLSQLGAPPSLSQTQAQQVAVKAPTVAPPSVGLPKAVPDDQAPSEVNIATQADLAKLSEMRATDVIGGGKDSISMEVPEDEYLPTADEFVPYDVEPKFITEVQPDYPELARKAGIEGVVFVSALVDKHGKVRDAKIAKASGANAGFEEAALKAAYKNEFKPAIANNEPISCWATYRVDFKLK